MRIGTQTTGTTTYTFYRLLFAVAERSLSFVIVTRVYLLEALYSRSSSYISVILPKLPQDTWSQCSMCNFKQNVLIATFSNSLNTLRPKRNGHHFPHDMVKWIFMNENACVFRLEYHWGLFVWVQLTIFQHWLRWWPVYRNICEILGLNELRLPSESAPWG